MMQTYPKDKLDISYHSIERYASRILDINTKLTADEVRSIKQNVLMDMPSVILDVPSMSIKRQGVVYVIKEKTLVTVYKQK